MRLVEKGVGGLASLLCFMVIDLFTGDGTPVRTVGSMRYEHFRHVAPSLLVGDVFFCVRCIFGRLSESGVMHIRKDRDGMRLSVLQANYLSCK